ncbi:hypothetical protein NFI96_009779 [Prochilodus magdalenae]|nr:hypothetical protein NFI96_009779 [Prochilodus magdalenae]
METSLNFARRFNITFIELAFLTAPVTHILRSGPSDTSDIVYTPPAESPYYCKDFFHNLHTESSHFQAQGNVLLCGDFNDRTGSEPDTTDTGGNKNIFKTSPNLTPTATPRFNPDSAVNKNDDLDLLEQFCQNWALTVNLDKTKIVIFQKKARNQER